MTEKIVDPDFSVVDTHHHLWRRADSIYGAEQFLADACSGHHVIASVAVEAQVAGFLPEAALAETLSARQAAETCAGALPGPGIAAAIIGFVDLLRPDAAEALDAQIEAAGGRLRGIRQKAAWHADPLVHAPCLNPHPGLLRDPAFRRGLAALAARGLLFEAFVYHHQLADLLDLAQKFPDTTIVLEHAGCPVLAGADEAERGKILRDWAENLRRLAACPNMLLKISGLGMTSFGTPARSEDGPATDLAMLWQPIVDTCLEAFGSDRCVLGSNAPVDLRAGSYAEIWNALKRTLGGCNAAEKTALFSGNAGRIYDLPNA